MFLIIGDGHEKQNLYDYVKERHINNIIFCGFKDNIHIILPELDIFLITSKTEGLGTSVLDAFACRVPVVATSAGGIPEIVEHLKTGLLAPVKDVSGIVDCINNLLNSTKLKETLIDNAFERVKQFSTKQMAEKTLFFYQTNLNK